MFPCAIQYILVDYFIHNGLYILVPYPYLPPPSFPLAPVTPNLFSISVSVLLYSLVCCVFLRLHI